MFEFLRVLVMSSCETVFSVPDHDVGLTKLRLIKASTVGAFGLIHLHDARC